MRAELQEIVTQLDLYRISKKLGTRSAKYRTSSQLLLNYIIRVFRISNRGKDFDLLVANYCKNISALKRFFPKSTRADLSLCFSIALISAFGYRRFKWARFPPPHCPYRDHWENEE